MITQAILTHDANTGQHYIAINRQGQTNPRVYKVSVATVARFAGLMNRKHANFHGVTVQDGLAVEVVTL